MVVVVHVDHMETRRPSVATLRSLRLRLLWQLLEMLLLVLRSLFWWRLLSTASSTLCCCRP